MFNHLCLLFFLTIVIFDLFVSIFTTFYTLHASLSFLFHNYYLLICVFAYVSLSVFAANSDFSIRSFLSLHLCHHLYLYLIVVFFHLLVFTLIHRQNLLLIVIFLPFLLSFQNFVAVDPVPRPSRAPSVTSTLPCRWFKSFIRPVATLKAATASAFTSAPPRLRSNDHL